MTISEKIAVLLDILLAAIGDPAFILDEFGSLQVANQAGVSLCAAGFTEGTVRGSRMLEADKAAMRLIQEVAATECGPNSGKITVKGPDNLPLRLSVTAVPNLFTDTATAEPAGEAQLVLITVRPLPRDLNHKALAVSFGLTPAEARVLEKCLEGLTIPEVAAQLGRSRRTVENHLQAVYRKSGVRRLSELILLASRYS
jgi:DNA-binding CsgD family transcriptional regulator